MRDIGPRTMQGFIETARAARICIGAKTTHWTAAMRNYRTFPDGDVNASDRP